MRARMPLAAEIEMLSMIDDVKAVDVPIGEISINSL
jgi:hypothetical protein